MKLSKEELQQLIDDYRTELRLLTYRTQQISGQLKGLEKDERTAKSKRKPGRPAAKAAKAGRPAKKAAKKAAKKTAKKAAKKAVKKTAKKAAKRRGRPAKKAPVKKATAKRGRPAKKASTKKASTKKASTKKASAKKATAKRGRPAGGGAAGKSGYRLNAWDAIVLNTLTGRTTAGVFSDFFDNAKRDPASKGLSQKDLYARINQSLHKLANKRGAIKKVEHEGRGFGYMIA